MAHGSDGEVRVEESACTVPLILSSTGAGLASLASARASAVQETFKAAHCWTRAKRAVHRVSTVWADVPLGWRRLKVTEVVEL